MALTLDCAELRHHGCWLLRAGCDWTTPKPLPIASSDVSGDKSFADDLNKERGIVSCRVALLLRSAEIKLLRFSVLF